MVDANATPSTYSTDELVTAANSALAEAGARCGRDLGAVSLRTVRFYATIGVIPMPEKKGRSAVYTSEHLEAVVRARTLQAEGLTLDEIRERAGDAGSDGERFWQTRPAPLTVSAAATANTPSQPAMRRWSSYGRSVELDRGVRLVIDADVDVSDDVIEQLRHLTTTR